MLSVRTLSTLGRLRPARGLSKLSATSVQAGSRLTAYRSLTAALQRAVPMRRFSTTKPPEESRTSGKSGSEQPQKPAGNQNLGMYLIAAVIFMIGGTYLSVPLYRKFCQVTGYGGTTQTADDDKLTELYKWKRANPDKAKNLREVTVSFNTDVGDGMSWEFKPTQTAVRVRVGEPTLAFFTAKNNLDRAATGVATYNVTPMKAGLYFNKVQCFCFDEQRLRAGEEVEMPVWFFIDPKFEEDRRMRGVDDIVLSYTFWPQEIEEPETEAAAQTAAAIATNKASDNAPAPECPMPPVPAKPQTVPAPNLATNKQ